jgi:uncharacterized protein HemY
MTAADYKREAELLSELASLAIREGEFGKADLYLGEAQLAIKNMRKVNNGERVRES